MSASRARSQPRNANTTLLPASAAVHPDELPPLSRRRAAQPRKARDPLPRMGGHPLFRSAATAKRFPGLSRLSDDEMAAMYHVPPVDRLAEKQAELRFHEPHLDRPVEMRTLLPMDDAPPFVATAGRNASWGREQPPPTSVFCNFDADADRTALMKKQHSEDVARRVTTAPFSAGSRTQAQARLTSSTVYLNALDQTAVDRSKVTARSAIRTAMNTTNSAMLALSNARVGPPAGGGKSWQSTQ